MYSGMPRRKIAILTRAKRDSVDCNVGDFVPGVLVSVEEAIFVP